MEIFCKICLIILWIIKSFIHFHKGMAEEISSVRFATIWGVIIAVIIEGLLLFGAGVFNLSILQ